MKHALGAALALGLALGSFDHDARADARPRRIVSINLCTDQLLLDLVPAERIAALSHLATDASVSATPEHAAGLPITHGGAEEVMALDPDLVVTVEYSTPASVAMLRRMGKRVVVLPLASDFDGIRAHPKFVAFLKELEAPREPAPPPREK